MWQSGRGQSLSKVSMGLELILLQLIGAQLNLLKVLLLLLSVRRVIRKLKRGRWILLRRLEILKLIGLIYITLIESALVASVLLLCAVNQLWMQLLDLGFMVLSVI